MNQSVLAGGAYVPSMNLACDLFLELFECVFCSDGENGALVRSEIGCVT